MATGRVRPILSLASNPRGNRKETRGVDSERWEKTMRLKPSHTLQWQRVIIWNGGAEGYHLEWRGRGLSSGMEEQRVPGELDKGLLSW